MGMCQYDRVDIGGRKTELVVVAVVGVTSLEHAAIDQNTAFTCLKQITGPRNLSGRSQKTYFHERHRDSHLLNIQISNILHQLRKKR
jgi:hypothetical protein